MVCDRCSTPTQQAHHATGIPESEYWCVACCDAQGIVLGNVRNYQPASTGNEIRDRWLAQQRAKKQSTIDKLRTSKGQGAFYRRVA